MSHCSRLLTTHTDPLAASEPLSTGSTSPPSPHPHRLFPSPSPPSPHLHQPQEAQPARRAPDADDPVGHHGGPPVPRQGRSRLLRRAVLPGRQRGRLVSCACGQNVSSSKPRELTHRRRHHTPAGHRLCPLVLLRAQGAHAPRLALLRRRGPRRRVRRHPGFRHRQDRGRRARVLGIPVPHRGPLHRAGRGQRLLVDPCVAESSQGASSYHTFQLALAVGSDLT